MKKVPVNEVHLIEDHNQSYFLWAENKIKGATLVHVDAHLDYDNNHNALVDRSNITIGNYIYPAIKNGIVNDFYWVIPGTRKTFFYNGLAIKRSLSLLEQKERLVFLRYENGLIHLKLGKINFYICVLGTLPTLKKPTLLDIDVDYFVNRSLNEAYDKSRIDKKTPWLSTKSFATIIKNKVEKPIFTTIAYSTNGSWTPMKYKYLGDQLAKEFGFKNKELTQRLIAARYLKKFRVLLKQKKYKQGRKYYLASLQFNPTYKSKELNNVITYLKNNQIDLALIEAKNFLRIDPGNPIYLMQLGIVYLKMNKLDLAQRYIKKASIFKPVHNISVVYLGYIAIKKQSWEEAEKILDDFKEEKDYKLTTLFIFLKKLTQYVRSKKLHYQEKFLKDFFSLKNSLPTIVGMETIWSELTTLIKNDN